MPRPWHLTTAEFGCSKASSAVFGALVWLTATFYTSDWKGNSPKLGRFCRCRICASAAWGAPNARSTIAPPHPTRARWTARSSRLHSSRVLCRIDARKRKGGSIAIRWKSCEKGTRTDAAVARLFRFCSATLSTMHRAVFHVRFAPPSGPNRHASLLLLDACREENYFDDQAQAGRPALACNFTRIHFESQKSAH